MRTKMTNILLIINVLYLKEPTLQSKNELVTYFEVKQDISCYSYSLCYIYL